MNNLKLTNFHWIPAPLLNFHYVAPIWKPMFCKRPSQITLNRLKWGNWSVGFYISAHFETAGSYSERLSYIDSKWPMIHTILSITSQRGRWQAEQDLLNFMLLSAHTCFLRRLSSIWSTVSWIVWRLIIQVPQHVAQFATGQKASLPICGHKFVLKL